MQADGRAHHQAYCPVERWLVDADVGDPPHGVECVATSDAGARAGETARYDATHKKWTVLPRA